MFDQGALTQKLKFYVLTSTNSLIGPKVIPLAKVLFKLLN